MVVEKIFDDLFATKHIVLSAMALRGYKQSGKGAIPLLLEFSPSADDNYDVRMEVRAYQSTEYFHNMAPDQSFQELLATYNPTTTGIIVFHMMPMNRAGYFKFTLTPSAVQHAHMLN